VKAARTGAADSWIIGYGNPQRRDDGIGPYIVRRLQERFKESRHIRFRTAHQLEPGLVEELQYADRIVFVDATINPLRDGWEWVRVRREPDVLPYLTHHFKPSFVLTLFHAVYQRSPRTWQASVQGNDFGFGEGFSSEATARVEKAISGIVKRMAIKGIDKIDNSVKL